MICLVVALPAEARPLIDAFKLQRHTSITGFPVYTNKESTSLVVSGIGRLASATATAYLQGLLQDFPDQNNITTGWLNIGIAGSGTLSVGDDILAHRITDLTTQQSFYPGLCFEPPCVTADVVTGDSPETAYPETANPETSNTGNTVYDMEAAGFYSAASRFSTAEIIHSYKIISDNKLQSVENITENFATGLISNKLDNLNKIITHINDLTRELNSINEPPAEYANIASHWRFTASQQHQLKSLLIRWQALTDEPFLNTINPDEFRNSKQLLLQLETTVNKQPLRMGPE